MNTKKLFKFAPVFVPVMLLIGCAWAAGTGAQTTVPVQELFSSLHGPSTDKQFQAQWIKTPDQAATIAGWPPTAPNTRGNELSTWDPKQQSRLWVQMGQKPTGGYSLHLARTEATVENGVATVLIDFRPPPADAFVPQVLTSPCLLLSIGNADFHTIHIKDQDGGIRARLH
jgi:hypothetical protein